MDDRKQATIHLRVPADMKVRWVKASQAEGQKLSEWIVKTVEAKSLGLTFQKDRITIYSVPCPGSPDAVIEVYGNPKNGCYEWRIIEGGLAIRDTGTEGSVSFRGRQYGIAAIAMRDALMVSTGLGDPNVDENQK